MKKKEGYSVETEPLTDINVLEKDWRTLEKLSECSFFLSWVWIKSWLTVFNAPCQVVRVIYEGKTVGMALLVESEFNQWNRASSKRIYLHQTGCDMRDQIWIEYNGFLCQGLHKEGVVSAFLSHIATEPDWDELVIGGLTSSNSQLFDSLSDLNRRDLSEAPTFGVDLENLAHLSKPYLSQLSKNTRYQINRSFKLYCQLEGEVRLEFAEGLEQAIEFFNSAGTFHLARWGDRLGESGYANEYFVDFHHELIRQAWPLGLIDLIQVKAGDKILGYLYNFLYCGKVYFYLSGLVDENDSKLKPGLCGHSMAIQVYLEKGYGYYDFMAGEARYKASLGCRSEDMFQVSYRRSRLKFQIEDGIRRLKKSLGT